MQRPYPHPFRGIFRAPIAGAHYISLETGGAKNPTDRKMLHGSDGVRDVHQIGSWRRCCFANTPRAPTKRTRAVALRHRLSSLPAGAVIKERGLTAGSCLVFWHGQQAECAARYPD
jgi:hypothetical protein